MEYLFCTLLMLICVLLSFPLMKLRGWILKEVLPPFPKWLIIVFIVILGMFILLELCKF